MAKPPEEPHVEEPPPGVTDTPDGPGTPADEPDRPDEADRAAPAPEPEPEPTRSVVASGFELEDGQQAQAFVHGAWRPAVVLSRGRRTVVVEYHLDDNPLGARQQRVTVDRIRVPPVG